MRVKRCFVIKAGEIRGIYEDGLSQKILERTGGVAKIPRASHIEASKGESKRISFEVDLSPSNGPIVRGFETRKEAINYEIDWINKNILEIKKP